MTIRDFYTRFSSDCTAGSANQTLTRYPEAGVHTGRIAYRLTRGGENYALLFSNTTDSTFADGKISAANDVGGAWDILSLRVGLACAWDAEPETWHTVTFDGSPIYPVRGGGAFCTDPIPLGAHAGDYLIEEMTLRGADFPFHKEIRLNVRLRGADGAWVSDQRIPAPLMIGCDRPVSLRAGFLGDSITQGCGTPCESYAHWVAGIAARLDPRISVWDLGIGYARGYDAATDRGWLARAKTCDVVSVCFGVNDLNRGRTPAQVIGDLRAVTAALINAGCRVILFTVPPFSYTGARRECWNAVNSAIRAGLGQDETFDMAAVLGRPRPDENLPRWGDHPNAEGCAAVARAFLAAGFLTIPQNGENR